MRGLPPSDACICLTVSTVQHNQPLDMLMVGDLCGHACLDLTSLAQRGSCCWRRGMGSPQPPASSHSPHALSQRLLTTLATLIADLNCLKAFTLNKVNPNLVT